MMGIAVETPSANPAAFTALRAATGLLFAPSPTAAALGNSIEGYGNNYPNGAVPNGNILTGGYIDWLQVLTMRAVRFAPTSIFGFPSRTVGEFFLLGKAAIEALSPRPAVLVIGCAVNNVIRSNGEQTFDAITGTGAYATTPVDVGTSTVTLSDSTTRDLGTTQRPGYAQIFSWARSIGMRVMVRPIVPRSDAVLTAAQAGVVRRVNRWLTEVGARDQGVYVLDYSAYLADPTGTLYTPRTGVTIDFLHPNGVGNYYIGKSGKRVVDRLPFVSPDVLIANSGVYDATNAPYDNLLANGMMTGTGGTVTAGTGVSGTAATSWTLDRQGGDNNFTVAGSSVTSAAFGGIPMQQIALGGTYSTASGSTPALPSTVNSARFRQGMSSGSFAQAAPLDVVEGLIYVEVDASNNLGGISLQMRDGNNTSIFNYGFYAAGGSVSPLPSEAWSGIIYVPPMTMAAAQSPTLFSFIYPKGDAVVTNQAVSATVRFGRASVRKVMPAA